MKKIRLHVFGYRDICFWSEYGPIVRDLMLVNALCGEKIVHDIHFYNRPTSILETLLLKKKINYSVTDLPNKLKFISKFSFDFFGPIKKRLWLDNIYDISYKDVELNKDYINVVLDFLPIGKLPKWAYEADFYWYDLIDNFQKHNRYSFKEKALVKEKYEFISNLNNCFVTAVSQSAISDFKNTKKLVLPNGLNSFIHVEMDSYKYDFGFMGFITDKLDMSLVTYLSNSGYKVAIFGEFYDQDVKVKLEKLDGVYIHGAFKFSDVPNILKTFKVGLLPYLLDKLHDESPLKLYQYICSGKNVLASTDFGCDMEHVYVYENDQIEATVLRSLNNQSPNKGFSRSFFESNSWVNRANLAIEGLLDSGN